MMVPCQLFINNSDQARNSLYSTKIGGGYGRSKAQLCLQKILHTILTIPPLPSTPNQTSTASSLEDPQNDTANEEKELNADLNVEILSVPSPTEMEDPPSPAAAVDKGLSTSGGDSELKEEKVEAFEEINYGFSESNGFCENNNNKEAAVQEPNKGEDCMGLLIQAAKMIFGDFKKEEEQSLEDVDVSPATTRPELKRRKQSWTAVDLYPDMEPVVRSKRGRTQVLPCKYRDSIVEPLTRVSRNRSTIIANKRRLR